MYAIELGLQKAARAGAHGLLGFGVEEADEEEGDVALPGDPAKGAEVGNGEHVAVAVLGV